MKDQSKHNPKIAMLIRFWNDIRALVSLIRAYWKGEYRDVSWFTIVSISLALFYIVFSPIGYIPVLGQIEDIIVLVICLKLIHTDLEKYKQFTEKQKKRENKV